MEIKRKYNLKKIFFKKHVEKKERSFAEEKKTPFFFCCSLHLYLHLFLNEQFAEIHELMRHEEMLSYEPSNLCI